MAKKISKHFYWYEFERSHFAARNGIDNTVPDDLRKNIINLAENVLEAIRERFGRVTISSGYRCNELNARIGGAAGSQHTKGQAADLQFLPKVDLEEVFQWIQDNLDYDQVIYEFGSWIHVSYNSKEHNRNRALIAFKDGTKTRYREV